jgi:5-(carboxyamino)imidazole ribonucleotide mutase
MNNPIVSIIMGSDSDLPIMQDAATFLEEMGISCEVSVISAHRTPDLAFDFAKKAASRGIKVIIAGAGGAAHLPGVIAALTALPVIGIPIMSKSLHGLDALLSIVQMPSGIPVATVGIDNAKNAAILATKILALNDSNLNQKLVEYQQQLGQKVSDKNNKLQQIGYQKYINNLLKDKK